MNTQLLIKAAVKKFRFPTKTRGELTLEDLFQLPLKAPDARNTDLNEIAGLLNAELQVKNQNFVDKAPADQDTQDKFDIVLGVIEIKKNEKDAREAAAALDIERQQIREAIARRRERDLEGESIEQLEARLRKLNGDTSEPAPAEAAAA